MARGREQKGLKAVRTYSPKPSEIERAWHVIDAEESRARSTSPTEVARLLRGKHKPQYAPHMDTGDNVVVVNAAKSS